MIQKYIIKRVGFNEEGADPLWIKEVRTIDKNESIPDGYEEIRRSVLRNELESQGGLYQEYTTTAPPAPKDFNLPSENLKRKAKKKDKSYKLYKYIASSFAENVSDVEMPPHGIDYTINTNPKLRPSRTFDKGFLINVVWYAWDWENNQAEEEVLKVDIEYVVDDNSALIPAARQVLSRTTKRQWMRENGTYDESERDVKITKKTYESPIERNEEGLRRRSNIFVQLVNDYVTIIAILKTSGDTTLAQSIGQLFLSQISTELTDYRSIGSGNILTKVETLTTDTITNDDYGLNITVPDITQIQSTVPDAISKTVSQFIIDRFKAIN